MPKIVGVTPNDDYTLTINLNNRHQIIYDMGPRLQTLRFSILADLDRFKSVRVEHGNTLIWDSLCQLTIDELIGTVISGFLRVCVENRLLPRTTTVYPARTTDPTRFFGNADNR